MYCHLVFELPLEDFGRYILYLTLFSAEKHFVYGFDWCRLQEVDAVESINTIAT